MRPTSDDGAERWTRTAVETTTFAPQRISRRPGRGSRAALAVGALAVVALVGAAALGSDPPSPRTTTLDRNELAGPVISASPLLISQTGWPPSRSAGAALVPVRLASPAGAGGLVTTPGVAVAGVLRIKAARIRVALETLSRERLAEATVDTTDPNGGIRPLQTPSFAVDLVLPTPRPVAERLIVVVIAYDLRGTPLGAVRRVITIGALATGAAPPA